MNRLSRCLALGSILAFAAACSDRGPTTVDLTPRVAEGVITCQVTVASKSMACDSPQLQGGAGMALNVTLGGQGTYVQLSSSGTAYSAAVFTSNVTIQNLTAQPMGTADGTTADANGIRVFFHSGPTVTGGTGAVTVTGDGTGNFTGTAQPYYQYTGPLAPGATSSSKTWTFGVPATVTTFTFSVLVSTKLPDDNGVLRWMTVTPPAGVATTDFDEIVSTGDELWAVGANGKIIHYTDAGGWVEQTSGTTQTLHSIEMSGGGGTITGVAVGAGGTFLYYNGTSWAAQTIGTAELMSVSTVGDQTTTWVACGLGGVIYSSTNGTSWTQMTSNTALDLNICGGPAANDIFAAGGTSASPAFITHYNGTAWSSTGYTSTATAIFREGFGCGSQTSTTDIWLAGDAGTIQHATSPFTTFTAQTSGTTANLYGAGETGNCTSFYLVGSGGTILHYNGTGWSAQRSGISSVLNDVEVRSTFNGTTEVFRDAWAVGIGGMILHGVR
ncbi:MAG: hypothetical protein HY700_21560 [Gemmatimonadetes bacterium]|nr:hypothetical protein [Gemmatimonadota bacterium]